MSSTKQSSVEQSQVGGSHYKDMPIQVMEFCQKNRLTWGQSSVIKYTVRHEKKGGIEDLKKAIHCLKMIAWYDYGVDLDDDETSDKTKTMVIGHTHCSPGSNTSYPAKVKGQPQDPLTRQPVDYNEV